MYLSNGLALAAQLDDLYQCGTHLFGHLSSVVRHVDNATGRIALHHSARRRPALSTNRLGVD
jgi:hypothetical protein